MKTFCSFYGSFHEHFKIIINVHSEARCMHHGEYILPIFWAYYFICIILDTQGQRRKCVSGEEVHVLVGWWWDLASNLGGGLHFFYRWTINAAFHAGCQTVALQPDIYTERE
jgi:hypothetical protein